MSIISIRAKLEERDIDVSAIEAGAVEVFIKSVGSIAHSAQSEWQRIAQERLKTSRETYVNGLNQSKSFTTKIIGNVTVFEIMLVGDMPNNFEFGMNAFDMKTVRPGWLGGGKAKTAKDGSKYITIPFRHSLTSAATMAYTGIAKKHDLKNELVRVVKQYGLDKMVRTAAGQVVSGPVTRAPRKLSPHPYIPSVHRYLRGLTRVQQPTRGKTPKGLQTGSSQLMTWRTMSEKSPAGSWIHPGVKAANILPEVERWLHVELEKTIDMMFGD